MGQLLGPFDGSMVVGNLVVGKRDGPFVGLFVVGSLVSAALGALLGINDEGADVGCGEGLLEGFKLVGDLVVGHSDGFLLLGCFVGSFVFKAGGLDVGSTERGCDEGDLVGKGVGLALVGAFVVGHGEGCFEGDTVFGFGLLEGCTDFGSSEGVAEGEGVGLLDVGDLVVGSGVGSAEGREVGKMGI